MTEEFQKPFQFRLRDAAVLFLVLSIFLGLLLSAISPPHESSRRAACSNQLRQLATAAHCFLASEDRFPGYAETAQSDVRDYSWVVALAPYLDHRSVWDEWNAPTFKPPSAPFLPILWCQSNGSHPDRSRPVLNYVANVGLLDSDENLPANGIFLDQRGSLPVGDTTRTTRVTYEHLVDGFSNTILFSENQDAGKWTELEKFKIGVGWWNTTTPSVEMRINGGQSGTSIPLARPSSRHPGGVMAAFADSSTRFLSKSIEYRVYIQLLTPDDQHSNMPEKWKQIKLSAEDLE